MIILVEYFYQIYLFAYQIHYAFTQCLVDLAWRSGSVMDCHATARGSIPGGNGVFTELHVLRKGQ